ncbi:hypothetical protein PPL_08568 [Heterostelium album PN500]|uniref:COI1 F-box domain-containing protein n=1 Tax=Heterostelium pallidum (strain ATCC 26659 / Pp 5 / PN500) TaxID=670386 RepID=D3BJ44_HETP5|nr:hypothetical protein PPL_08568 [Heterostelium album PN500]EFA77924.1 hypothetical protein PPL_08568 [Heterostelium album PN500]|eukprot:XP_020430052.1 hypothetical protein PPL_08568 [Heterostelium album PN500]
MNNQKDKIVNLSHLILNKIISYLDDNIDRICFSLVCKRWYNDRDKYLIFNIDSTDLFTLNTTDFKQYHKHFKLQSYHNIFIKSIQSKTDCSLYIGYKNYDNLDYHYDDQEYLYRLISESQSVTTLNGCSTLKYGLPKSIRSLTFNNFDEPLVKGSLHNSLEVLDFQDFNQEILPGVLPDGLRKLTLNSYQYEIQAGVLPCGLREFILTCYDFEIKAGVLPVGLLEFSLESSISYQYDIQPGVLPLSLEYLSLDSYEAPEDPVTVQPPPSRVDLQYSSESCLPISWLQAISSLAKLQTLSVYFQYQVGGEDATIFNINYLPRTLKSFNFIMSGTVLRGTFPTSLKKYYIGVCQFTDELFPRTLQYHLASLEYENKILLPIPSNISIDELIMRGDSNEPKITLPSCVKKIKFYLTNTSGKIIDFDDQSCALRELHLLNFQGGLPQVNLPNTIELLDLGWNDLNETLHLVPSSVKTLIFSKQSEINITIPNIIKSIPNIIGKFGFFHTQTIRKLDENYYLMYGDYENNRNIVSREKFYIMQLLSFSSSLFDMKS